MPEPKRKRSRARRDSRFANKHLIMNLPGRCQTCQAPLASHQVCKMCGYYKGVKVLRTKAERMQNRGGKHQAASTNES